MSTEQMVAAVEQRHAVVQGLMRGESSDDSVGAERTRKPRRKVRATGGIKAESGAKPSAGSGVLVIGDSLTVGAATGIREALAGQRVDIDARVGRGLAEGMRQYASHADKPKVVEMALFTNDAPGNLSKLRSAIEQTVKDARSRGGRVVWATVHRPPVGGQSYDRANELIRSMARENPDVMKLVDWEAAVQAHPDFVGRDHVHGTAAGNRFRAEAFARAAK